QPLRLSKNIDWIHNCGRLWNKPSVNMLSMFNSPIRLKRSTRQTEMFRCQARNNTPARRFLQQTFLNQKWLVHFFDRVRLFAQSRRYSFNADRPTVELFLDKIQNLTIHLIEPQAVDFEFIKRRARQFSRDDTVAANIRIITYASKQTIGNTRCTATASRDFFGT